MHFVYISTIVTMQFKLHAVWKYTIRKALPRFEQITKHLKNKNSKPFIQP